MPLSPPVRKPKPPDARQPKKSLPASLPTSHPLERQADARADEVMQTGAVREQSRPAAPLHGSPLGNDGLGLGGGSPMSSYARAFLEPRFGAPLDDVRIHADGAAHSLANRAQARAFAHGQHIFFAEGELRPHTQAGMRLLAHEVAHTFQPETSYPVLRRTPASNKCTKIPANQFTQHQTSNGDEHIALFVECPDLIDKIQPDQIVEHGPRLVSQLIEWGHPDIARRLLARMTGNQIPEAWKRDIQLTPKSVTPGTADSLIEHALRAALERDHGLAMELLAVAYGLVQVGLFQGSNYLHQKPDHTYDFTGWQECLQKLFAIYPMLIRHYQRKGDRAEAKRYQAQWTKLQADLFENHTIKETPVPRQILGFGTPPRGANDIDPIVLGTAVATVPEVKSDLYTQYKLLGTGSNSATDVVSPMTREQSLVRESTLTDSMEQVAKDVAGQQDVLTEIDGYANGAIHRAFPDGLPNLREREGRIRVWTAAYEALLPMQGIAFQGLMNLIAKYLSVFTLHSSWNVADSGTSYLSKDMPTDVAGRLLQDCGVYAMSVATEAFAAVKRSGKGKLSSEIFVLPAHVIMVLFHETAGECYVVNNDKITGPIKGSPDDMDNGVYAEISRAFAGVIGNENDPVKDVVAPLGRVKMGATDEFSEQQFNDRYWDRYSTVSRGYDAIAQADFPDEATKAVRSSLGQYEVHMFEYRKDSAKLLEAIVPMLGMSDTDLLKQEEKILALVGPASRMLERYVTYGTRSATPDREGGVVAPRGGKTREARRAAAVLEPPKSKNIDPHIYFTESKTKTGDHPLADFRKILDRFMAAKGTTPDCSMKRPSLDGLSCDLRITFP